ncbi:MAG: response regulator [Acidobacteriota bacterium]
MKVLTVDDSRMIRTLVRKYLSSFPLNIIEAADGKQALEQVRAERPDLVILDINMPVMDGAAVLRELRRDPELKEVRVLMLTAESSERMVLEVIKLGISDYIVKPFQQELLLRKVAKILQLSPTGRPQVASPVTNTRRVLVVDDNESILLVARRFLTGIAEVVTTTRPEKALQLACQHAPQVVLLDLKADGLSVLRTLQKESGLSSSRFVGLATTSMAEQADKARMAGFSDVLFKPFDRESLTRVVIGESAA